jgi:hypothetical protein
VALVRALSDNIGLTAGLSRALASGRLLVHDRSGVLAALAWAIADGAEVISDFRVMTDQREMFGLVASVPSPWRTLDENSRQRERVTAAMNAARRRAWSGSQARHGAIPGVAIADKVLNGVTCVRLDIRSWREEGRRGGSSPKIIHFWTSCQTAIWRLITWLSFNNERADRKTDPTT